MNMNMNVPIAVNVPMCRVKLCTVILALRDALVAAKNRRGALHAPAGLVLVFFYHLTDFVTCPSRNFDRKCILVKHQSSAPDPPPGAGPTFLPLPLAELNQEPDDSKISLDLKCIFGQNFDFGQVTKSVK